MRNKTLFVRILPFLAMASLVLMAFFSWLLIPLGPFSGKVFLSLATFFSIFDFALNKERLLSLKRLRWLLPFMLLIIFAMVVGSLVSIQKLFVDVFLSRAAFIQTLILISNIIALLLVVVYGLTSQRFLEVLSFVFILPAVLAPIFFLHAFQPAVQLSLSFPSLFLDAFRNPYHFGGSIANAFFAFLLIFPTTFFFWAVVTRRSLLVQVGSIGIVVLLIATMMQAGSRASLLGVFVAFFAAGYTFLVKESGGMHRYVAATLLFLLILGLFAASFAILPSRGKLFFLSRLNQQALTHYGISGDAGADDGVLRTVAPHVFLGDIQPGIGQNRFSLWRQASGYAKVNILGYGPMYASVINLNDSGVEHTSPHNLFIEGMLAGGVALFLLLLVIVYYVIRYMGVLSPASIKGMITGSVPFAALGILAHSLFFDGLFFRLLWIVGGLYIAYIIQQLEPVNG